MSALYITSAEIACGTTALCAGIGKKLTGLKKVGFFIPARFPDARVGAEPPADATFFKETFQLPETVEQLCPLVISPGELWQCLTDDLTDFSQQVRQMYRNVARDKDIVIMEGLGNISRDKVSELACYTIPEVLDAKVIIVVRYAIRPDTARVMQICKKLGNRLLGVVINFVPESKAAPARQHFAKQFQDKGIPVLGVLPQLRSLLGVTVAELSKVLGGELILGNGNQDAIIENVMLGAMTPGSGIDYFSRKDNKAVVVRIDRPDMQLAALQTSTRCLVLTNADGQPSPIVLSTAQDKHVPIILTKKRVPETIAAIEKALGKVSFAHPEKVRRFSSAMESHFDFSALFAGLGLSAT